VNLTAAVFPESLLELVNQPLRGGLIHRLHRLEAYCKPILRVHEEGFFARSA
jgi:hypothetical protein